MAKRRQLPTEAVKILKNVDIEVLVGLQKITKNENEFKALRYILEMLHGYDTDRVLKQAGGVVSMDALINSSTQQSFYRGRISMGVLVNTLLLNSGRYLEIRQAKVDSDAKKKKKKR